MAVVAPPGLKARSAALNKLYGLPAPAATKPPAETDWERALRLRSEAMNKRLGLPNTTTDTGGTKTQAPTDPPPAANIHVPGFDPDYGALIAADPNLIAGEGDLTAYGNQIDQGRTAAIRRAVIGIGLSPGSQVGEIDQATLDAAAANPNSTKAVLDTQKTNRNTDLEALLAARGILDSGAQTGGKQRIQTNYDTAQAQAVQTLLDQISGYEQTSADKKFQIAQQHQALREAAALRVQADPRYQPVGATDAVLDPSTGLYMTPDGRWYNPDGSAAPAPSSSAPADTSTAPPAAPPTSPYPVNGGRFARDEILGLRLY